MSRRPYGAALVVLALLAGLLGLLPPATAAPGGGTTLTVQLEIGGTPVAWGDDATFVVSTNRPSWEGALQIWRINADNTRTVVANPDDVGSVTVDTRTFPVGDFRFVATAIEPGQTAESVVRYLTVAKRATTTTYLDTTSQPMGSFRAQVTSGDPDLVPTGAVRFTGPSIDVTRRLDEQGVAVLDGIAPGTRTVRASYVCEGPYDCSTVETSLWVDRFTSEAVGELSAPAVRAGDPVSVRIWLEGRVDFPATGGWLLLAQDPDGAVEQVAIGVHEDGDSFDVDLTAWAAEHPGTWMLQLDYDGNSWTKGFWKAQDLGTLTVTEARTTTETLLEPPATGIPVGGTVTVKVSSTTGLPAGLVTLHAQDGTVLATASSDFGMAVLTLPTSLRPGDHLVWAEYAGSADHYSSVTGLVPLRVVALADTPGGGTPGTPGTPGGGGTPGTPGTPATAKASSSVTGKAVGKRRSAVLTVTVGASLPVSGTVQVRDGKRLVHTVTLRNGRASITLKRLRKGKHRLTVAYLGSATVASSQRTWSVRVR